MRHSPPPRSNLWLVAIVAIVTSLAGIFNHSLWTPDEPRVAAIGAEMLRSGDLIVPTLSGVPFLEKPPLYWWIMCACYRAFGISDGVARLPSVLAAIATLLIVYFMARRLADERAGLMAVLALSTLNGFHAHVHRAMVDPLLAAAVTLGYWGFTISWFAPAGTKPDVAARRGFDGAGRWTVMYAGGALAFLTKGPIGLVLLAAPVLLAMLRHRHRGALSIRAHLPGLALVVAGCLLWPALLFARDDGYLLRHYVSENLVKRVVMPDAEGYSGGHENPIWYYLTLGAPPMLLPWLVAVPALFAWLRRRTMPADWNAPALAFAASALPVAIGLLSIPDTKRGVYLLPTLPVLAVAMGAWFSSMGRPRQLARSERWAQLAVLMCVAVAPLLAALTLVLVARGSTLWGLDRIDALVGVVPRSAYLLIAAFAVTVGTAVAWGVSLWRRASTKLISLLALLILAIFTTYSVIGFPLLDGPKNLHRVTRDLKQSGEPRAPMVAFLLDEAGRAILSLDLELTPRNITTPQDMLTFARANPGARVFALERRVSAMPVEVRDHLVPLRRWPMSNTRAYVLYVIGTVP